MRSIVPFRTQLRTGRAPARSGGDGSTFIEFVSPRGNAGKDMWRGGRVHCLGGSPETDDARAAESFTDIVEHAPQSVVAVTFGYSYTPDAVELAM